MRGLLFLLSALFLLELIKGMEYMELNDPDRKIVDEAIEEGNTVHGQRKHLDYYNIFKRNDNVFEVILRPTSCDKTTQRVHRKECQIQNEKPQVSCIHCNGAVKSCLLLKQKEEVNITTLIEKMRKECLQHHTGGIHLHF
uniref:Cystatin domain-containing protein n=1 Tax=Cyprinus carpio TaxID=7962 RepID=A0A8C1NC57_CYPCA